MEVATESKYPKKREKKYIKKMLLNSTEMDFFDKLKTGLVGLQVFPQVSMNQVLNVEQQRDYKDRLKFWAKIIDFTICTPQCEIIAMVELDGPSHDKPDQKAKDAERDAMLKQAGYIVIRYDWRKEVTDNQLNKDFKRIIHEWNRRRLCEKLEKELAELEK